MIILAALFMIGLKLEMHPVFFFIVSVGLTWEITKMFGRDEKNKFT